MRTQLFYCHLSLLALLECLERSDRKKVERKKNQFLGLFASIKYIVGGGNNYIIFYIMSLYTSFEIIFKFYLYNKKKECITFIWCPTTIIIIIISYSQIKGARIHCKRFYSPFSSLYASKSLMNMWCLYVSTSRYTHTQKKSECVRGEWTWGWTRKPHTVFFNI